MQNAFRKKGDKYRHYQLIRNVLAANDYGASFYLLCDRRRPDLINALEEVLPAIKSPELRNRCNVLTWQEITAVSDTDLRKFLAEKYGIG